MGSILDSGTLFVEAHLSIIIALGSLITSVTAILLSARTQKRNEKLVVQSFALQQAKDLLRDYYISVVSQEDSLPEHEKKYLDMNKNYIEKYKIFLDNFGP